MSTGLEITAQSNIQSPIEDIIGGNEDDTPVIDTEDTTDELN